MDKSFEANSFFRNLHHTTARQLLLSLPIAIVYIEGEDLYFNQATSDLLGYSNLEIKTLTDWETIVIRNKLPMLQTSLPQVLTIFRKNLSICFIEIILYKEGGTEFWVLHNISNYLQTPDLSVNLSKKTELAFSNLVETLSNTVLDGKYRLEEKIGKGGYGVVYQATQLTLQRAVAIKIFRPLNNTEDQENFNRFQIEGLSACKVNHPNAVSILDSGISSEGIVYLVMELLDGHSLARELDLVSTLPVKRCLEILIPTCQALAEAHRVGIIHRDIKPDNIFLHKVPQGEIVKIVDFGIAKFLDYKSQEMALTTITEQGTVIGTPIYMSPERLSNTAYDGRADIYSMGVIFYQMLSGKVPFEIGQGGIFSLAMKHLSEHPIPLREIDPNIPLQIEDIVLRMLRKEVSYRPTAEELLKELQKLLSSLSEKDLYSQHKKTRCFTFFDTQTMNASKTVKD
jgi:serine/threonine protein kinase